MVARMAFAVVDVRCSERVEHSGSTAGIQRLRAHAMGDSRQGQQADGAVVLARVRGEDIAAIA